MLIARDLLKAGRWDIDREAERGGSRSRSGLHLRDSTDGAKCRQSRSVPIAISDAHNVGQSDRAYREYLPIDRSARDSVASRVPYSGAR